MNKTINEDLAKVTGKVDYIMYVLISPIQLYLCIFSAGDRSVSESIC